MANTPETANSIKGLFQGLIPDPGGVEQGTVTSVLPLNIKVEGDDKLILTETTIIVPRHLTNHTVTVDISGGTVNAQTDSHSHTLVSFVVTGATMTVYNALKVGDKVHLLSFNAGKQYYVLDKVV